MLDPRSQDKYTLSGIDYYSRCVCGDFINKNVENVKLF